MIAKTKDITHNTKSFDVAVIGAGPAGIMAAIFATKTGAKVVLLEKNETVGRKILATGNGRCNITNQDVTLDKYHGQDVSFAKPVIASFDQHATMKFFESIGVELKEENRGRMFPRSDKASDVVNALKAELEELNVHIYTSFIVKQITPFSLSSLVANPGISSEPSEGDLHFRKNDNLWQITGENGQTITATKLVLTTGGKAAYQFGSSGDGLFWTKNLGHTIVPIHAALVPMETKEDFVKDIMGIKLYARARLLADGTEVVSRDGDILFTHFGVSGPAAMGLAREVDSLLSAGKKVEISIDILPELSTEQLDEKITKLLAVDGKKIIKNILAEIVPKKLVPVILGQAELNPGTKAAEISRSERQQIISKIKDFRLTISKVRPLKEAQVMAGGVATSEIKPTLESIIVPGLYFAGEIVDIDGDSGGFNLQWAWSSGKVAGESACHSHVLPWLTLGAFDKKD